MRHPLQISRAFSLSRWPLAWLMAGVVLWGAENQNANPMEYGDAVYRYLMAPEWFFKNYNHTAVFSGLRQSDGSARVLQCDGTFFGDNTIDASASSQFLQYKSSGQYYGAKQLANKTLTFAERKSIVATAQQLVDANINWSYPSALDYFGGSFDGSIADIDNLRCDGLVEYAYEKNGHTVWWNKNFSSTQWSIVSYPDNHNDAPGATVNPDRELSPWAQRGAPSASSEGPGFSGTNPQNTNLTKTAVASLPTYLVTQQAGNGYVDITIKATDESGIHYIGYMKPGDSNWTYSDNQSQVPTSDSFTLSGIRVTTSGYIYVFAQDNGGNTPVDAIGYAVTVTSVTTPSVRTDAATNKTSTSATLNATVTDNGGASITEARFEWTSSSFPGTVISNLSVSGSTFSFNLTGLQPNTTYTYHAYARNSAGFNTSTNNIFFTTDAAQDTTPTSFSFTDVTSAETSTTYTSNTITVGGINAAATISITGGSYSVNGGGYTSSAGTVTNGATVTVRQTSSSNFGTKTSTVLTIGGVSDTYDVTTKAAPQTDTTPDSFSFTDVTNAETSTTYTSNSITVSGINATANISVSGGTYSINGGSYTSSTGTVTNGATVTVRQTSSSNFGTKTSTALTIGGVSDSYDITTKAGTQIDTTPDSFAFTDVTGAETNSAYTSNAISVAGINAAAAISVTGGSYSVNGGSYTSSSGTVTNGASVTVRQTSSASFSTMTSTVLTIGGVSDSYDVTTRAATADTTPDAFAFVDVTNAELTTDYTSNVITVSGINAAAAINVTGGSYSVNGGSYTSSSGTVSNGATVSVRMTSSASNATKTSTTLTIGGVSDSYDVTTKAGSTTGPSPPQLIGPGTSTPSGATSSSPVDVPYVFIASLSFVLNFQIEVTDTGSNTIVHTSSFNSFSNFGNATITVPYATLPAGRSYSWRARSEDTSGNPGSWSAPLYFSIPAIVTAPTISISPTSLSFSGMAGGGSPISQTISVSNSGGGTLNWTATVTSGSFLNLFGTTSSTTSGSFQVFADVGSLSAGSYNGNIQIAASGASSTPQNIPVTFTITSSVATTKIIALSGDLVFGDVPVGSTATRTLTIANSGTGILAVTGISYPAGFSGNWSGTVGPGGSQPVTVTFAPTAVQSYSGSITVSSDRTSGTNTASVSGNGASAGGGTLVNGGAHEGTIALRGSNTWTINLAANDTLAAQVGELSGNNSFTPSLEIYNPSGTLVANSWDYTATFVSHRAQTAGTYRVVVRSFNEDGTGTYRLHAVRAPGAIVVPGGDEGGALTNGAAHEGSITIGDLDAWTITLASGESLFLQAGEVTGNNSFAPSILLYDPAGALVQNSWDYLTASVSHRATVAGSYTVVFRSFLTEGTGTYRLHAVKAPGAITISAGDEGGELANGGAHEGTITVGDLDPWTMTLSGGDSIVVQIGELTGNNGFAPALRLYDPAGQLVQNSWDYGAAQVTHRAILAGTYTVVAYSFLEGAGTYRLHAVKTPGVLATPAGDEGGALTSVSAGTGAITRGDLDAWTINLAGGVSFAAQLDEQSGDSSFAPYLRLYDPNGVLVQNSWDYSGTRVSYQTITAGTYTILVSSFLSEGTGTYRLSTSPIISTQPQGQTVAVGASVTLQVGVTGTPTPTYQWRRNGTDIPNAAGASLVLTSAQTTDGGSYTVAVTNPAGTVMSSVATVSVVTDPNSPAITQRARGLSVEPGANVTLSAGLNSSASYQWRRNGDNIPGAGNAMFTLANMQPAYAGLYQAIGSGASVDPTIVGVSSTAKVIGTGAEVGQNIYVASNNNTFDQVALQGSAATITADSGQITRISYVDLTNDIVQVEFSGAGTLTLTLDSSSGPATAANYNQPGVTYMKGHASIVVTGANETTNVGVFSVGRITAVNQSLFRNEVSYDGMADVAYIAIQSTDGKFGGLRAANTTFYATRGLTGIYAPGVQFNGPVFVGDISAFDAATPVLMIGSSPDTRITGGYLLQANGQPVKVTGLTQLKFTTGSTSHLANSLPAQTNKARLEQNGTDVSRQIVQETNAVVGRVVAWGYNAYGHTDVPAGLNSVTAVTAGGVHTLALKSDGTVVAWGYNGSGQTSVPSGLTAVMAIAGGNFHSLALKADGTVVAWGANESGQATVPAGLNGVIAIAAGHAHTLALKSNGTVVAWGGNSQGETTVPAGLSGVRAIAASGYHSVALKNDGTVVCWGSNSSVPTGLIGVTAIAAGYFHTLALKSDGTVVAWGVNGFVPAGLTGVQAIAAAYDHNLALKADGAVTGWGTNGFGESNSPAGLSGVIAIACGDSYSLALVRVP